MQSNDKMICFQEVFRGKTVLVTGHTGFKGGWLSLWLRKLGARVVGISLEPVSSPSFYEAANLTNEVVGHNVDVRGTEKIVEMIGDVEPDFIFHLAAQALVRRSVDNPIETFTTNAIGSINILEAARQLQRKVIIVMVTSDKVYENFEWVWGYREVDTLGGKDPYSASKSMAELGIRSYLNTFFGGEDNKIRVAIARAGNVIGGGDWSSNRVVPDCIRAWVKNEPVQIRNTEATRPWQFVLEPLSGYLSLAATLQDGTHQHGEAYNFGPLQNEYYSVRQLINEMKELWGHTGPKDILDSENTTVESSLLKLNCDKALVHLAWTPTLRTHEAVRMTVEWYKANLESGLVTSLDQIHAYTSAASQAGLEWISK